MSVPDPIKPFDGVSIAVPQRKDRFPEDNASIISQVLFLWVAPLFGIGRKRPLQDSDVWEMNDRDRAENIYPKFIAEWEKEKASPNPSLAKALYRMIRFKFWVGGFFKIFNDASQFSGPIILSLLIVWVQSADRNVGIGVGLSVFMFVFQMIGALAEAQFFQNVMRCGMNAKGVLMLAVFKKTIRLSNASKHKVSTGKINTMIAADTDAINQFIGSAHNLWSAPFRVIVAIALIFVQLKWSGMIAALLFPITIPLQKYVIAKTGNYTKASLKSTDARVKVIGEALSSMSVVKSYNWQSSFQKKVEEIRHEELRLIRSAQYLQAFNYMVVMSLPIVVSVVAFMFHVLVFENELTVQEAFTSLSLFSVLTFPLFTLPMVLNDLINARVSISRMQSYFLEPDVIEPKRLVVDPSLPDIEIRNASFSWQPNGEPVLKDINVKIEHGQLVAVIGPTGSGKSSLISAILQDMECCNGSDSVTLRGSVAFVPQQAWIFGGSLRNNVIFGHPMDDAAFDRTVELSCLGPDLDLLPNGADTELGERGINLSGGQAQRTSIARAVYSNADVYLFDDPLSALDAHVGRQVFDSCIKQALSGRTRVLVTNQLQFLSQTDRIIMLKDGKIIEAGTFDELQASSPAFRSFISSDSIQRGESDSESEPEPVISNQPVSTVKTVLTPKPEQIKARDNGGLVVAEEREEGIVKRRVVVYFLRAFGGALAVLLCIGTLLLSEGGRVSSVIWLKYWTGMSSPPHGPMFYLLIYVGLSLSVALFVYFWRLGLAYYSLHASSRLHKVMFANLLRAPMLFFDQSPLGRLISRFSKDISDLDKVFISSFSLYVAGLAQTISTFGVLVYYVPIILVAATPVSILFWIVYKRFTVVSREVQRLDSITRSPIYTHFSQCLNGLSSIRAYRAGDAACAESSTKIDHNQRFTLTSFSCNRWLSIRLELLGGLMALGCALFVVLPLGVVNSMVTAALTGLLLNYALQITSLFNRNVRAGAMVENQFNSIERIMFFSEVPQEASEIIPGHRPPVDWPSQGKVKYVNASMRYRDGLPLVLNNLSVEFPAGSRIGIVGRTGAGKSSLFVSLFRLRELAEGSIEIDDVNIASIGLSDLRSKITIIPQTPILFTGSVRFNLDPFDNFTDDQVWNALKRSHIYDVIFAFEDKLDHSVAEGGENFSVGQRALLCLARALLRQSRVIVLDEATASVDPRTDELIQNTIRTEFKQCTLLIIAHRLHTVMDSDKVLVIGDGKALEYGVPHELLQNPSGALTSMVESTGRETSSQLRRIASRAVELL